MVTVSVIILNWNTSKDTIECLDSMRGSTYRDFEVVLVDNFSSFADFKNLEDHVKKSKLKIKLIRSRSNLGFTGGNNLGIKNSKGKFYCFLNNDTVVERNFLGELLKPFSKSKEVGCTAAKLLFYNNGKTKILQHAGRKITFYGMPVEEAIGQKDSKKYDVEMEEGCVQGACFMVSKEAMRKIREPFCEPYFIYFEEVDMSWRIRSAGYKIIYAPKSRVYHKGSVSMKVNRALSRQETLTIRNKYLTYYRNLPVASFVMLFPLIFAYDVMRAFKHILRLNPMFLANFLIGFSQFITYRERVMKPRKGSLSELSW